MTNSMNEFGMENPEAGETGPADGRGPWVKPALHRRGTIRGLTQAYLQGPPEGVGPPDSVGPPPDIGPPPDTKYVGSKDLGRSAQGT
jgi:hypothetical protein